MLWRELSSPLAPAAAQSCRARKGSRAVRPPAAPLSHNLAAQQPQAASNLSLQRQLPTRFNLYSFFGTHRRSSTVTWRVRSLRCLICQCRCRVLLPVSMASAQSNHKCMLSHLRSFPNADRHLRSFPDLTTSLHGLSALCCCGLWVMCAERTRGRDHNKCVRPQC